MKYVCLGYIEEGKWESIPEKQQQAIVKECMAYDEVLRRGGHMLGGECLESARNAVTLRWRDGRVLTTDGPFTETKEQLGGILFLEAADLNQAIQLMAKHPGVRMGPFVIRATQEHPACEAVCESQTTGASA